MFRSNTPIFVSFKPKPVSRCRECLVKGCPHQGCDQCVGYSTKPIGFSKRMKEVIN